MSIYLNRNFIISYLATFISMFGSKLLMMSYVAYIYETQSSATLTSIIFAAEWGTSLFVGIFSTQMIDRSNIKELMIKLNVFSGFVTLIFLFFTDQKYFYIAILIIIVRAYFSHMVNTARVKSLVQFFSPEESEAFTPIFNSSMFISTALAGMVGVFVLNYLSFHWIILIDALTFFISAFIFYFVRPNKKRMEIHAKEKIESKKSVVYHLQESLEIIRNNRSLASAIFYIILMVAGFQATYQILLTSIPQDWFNLGKSGTALFFTINSVAVTVGVFFYQFIFRRNILNNNNQEKLNLFSLSAALFFYLCIAFTKFNLFVCLSCFALMIFLMECIWTHQFKNIIKYTPENKLASVSGLQSALGYGLMGASTFIFGNFTDRFGITSSIYGTLGVMTISVILWEIYNHRDEKIIESCKINKTIVEGERK